MNNLNKFTLNEIVKAKMQLYKKLTLILIFFGLFTLLVGCSGNSESENANEENAYEKGVWDGAMDVCSETRRISQDVYEQLRRRNVC